MKQNWYQTDSKLVYNHENIKSQAKNPYDLENTLTW